MASDKVCVAGAGRNTRSDSDIMGQYEERLIIDFLKSQSKSSFSVSEICRRAGGRRMYEDDARWAVPVLLALRDRRIIEADASGHYQWREPR
jgi:hypothetical protein